MAAATYSSDLNDILVDMASTTGWTHIGNPAALTAPETDDFVQGNNCIAKGSWSTAIRGMIYNSAETITAGDAVFMWLKFDAPGSLDTVTGGGVRVIIGDASGAYDHWYVGGSDTLLYSGWICYVVDPTETPDTSTGTPGATTSYFGGLADVPASGPGKGSPWTIDAFRHGRVFSCIDGDLGNGYATFTDAAVWNDDSTRRWGLMQAIPGGYQMQGMFEMGVTATAVDFRDSNTSVLILDTPKAATGFNGLEIVHASSRVDWTSISFLSLGTQSPGYFTVVDNADVNLDACTFTDMGAFTFLAASDALSCIWRNCEQVDFGGGTFTDSLVAGYEGTAGTAATLWDTSGDPTGNLDGMTFEKGTAATHAIEFGSTAPATVALNGQTYTDYNASNGNNDSTFYNNTGGALTISVVGGTGNTSYRNGTAASTTVSVSYTVTVTCKDSNGDAIEGINIRVEEDPAKTLVDEGTTNASGIFTFAHTGSVPQDVKVIARQKAYRPNQAFDTITGTGLSVGFTMIDNPVVNLP